MKPKLFVGSSREGIEVARAVEVLLKEDCEVTIWDAGIFELSRSNLGSLVNALDTFDFAALVLTPDDLIQSRGSQGYSARDNVLFELGLFLGHLGRDRTFIVVNPADVGMPTDLEGIVLATYSEKRHDKNLVAALSPACTTLRKNIRNQGRRQDKKKAGLSKATDIGGFDAYYPRYPTSEMVESLRRAKKEILILQTWISNWNDLCEALGESLRASAKAGSTKSKLNIRIVLIKPVDLFCEPRGIHSGQRPGRSKSLAQTSVNQILDFKRRLGIADDQLEIRLSEELPTFAMFWADSTIYFNPYLRDRNTYQSPCFKFRQRKDGFSREIRKHFDDLWEKLGGSEVEAPLPSNPQADA